MTDVLPAANPDEDILDGYELVALLSQGGMGQVYRARSRASNLEVAVKLIHPSLATNTLALHRFDQEAQASSNLTHANVAAVFDYGKTKTGRPYLIMDLVDGSSLSEVLKREGFLDVDRAMSVFIQICDALIHAHCKGVVHRDLKPNNILLTKRHGVELVKVIDFGIAKLFAKAEGQITQTGAVFGTPAYMSPEQCLGLETDARSDIYSLGCLMYETLVGQLPFSGKNPIEMMVHQVQQKPILFGKRHKDLNIPAALQSLIEVTLEKEPCQRYQSMEKLRNDLERIKDGGRPIHLPAKHRSASKKSAARMLTSIAACGVVALLLALNQLSHPDKDETTVPTSSRSIPAIVQGPGIGLHDIHNNLLYRSATAADVSQAVNEALRQGVNLASADLSNQQLADITGVDSAKLAGANFSKSILRSCRLSGDFHGANFTGATLMHCDFSGNMEGINFSGVNRGYRGSTINLALMADSESSWHASSGQIPGGGFAIRSLTGKLLYTSSAARSMADAVNEAVRSGADLSDADLTNLNLQKLIVKPPNGKSKVRLECADFSGSTLIDAEFENVVWHHSKWSGTCLTNCQFDDSSLSELDWYKTLARYHTGISPVQGPDVSLSGDLRDSDFTNANVAYWRLGKIATKAKFVHAICVGAHLRNSDLTGADFSGADLSYADLEDCVLRACKLNGADLTGAELRNCLGMDLAGSKNARQDGL